MAKVTDPNRGSIWPWGGGPRSLRERLVDPAQFERKKRAKRAGDPKNPPLASSALLEFMGAGHASDEVRLPPPPSPLPDGSQEPTNFPDRDLRHQVVSRGAGEQKGPFEAALARVTAAPDKLERMKAVIQREAQMLSLVARIQAAQDAIIEMMKKEYKANGSY